MFDFKYVLKRPNSVFAGKKTRIFLLCGFYKGKSWTFSKFILKLRVYSEEILNLDNILVAAYLNR